MQHGGRGWWLALALLPALACGGSDGVEDRQATLPVDPGEPAGVPPPVVHAPPVQLPVELLGPALGGPHADVRDVSVDAGGGVWLAARSGLFVRPPGRRFARLVTAAEGMPGAEPVAVGGLGPGVAVVGFAGGERPRLVRLAADETATVEELPIDAAVRRIRAVEGMGLVASGSGLTVLDEGGRIRGRRIPPEPAVELWDVAVTDAGDAWIGDRTRLLLLEGPVTASVAGRFRAAPDLVPGEDDAVVAVEVCPGGEVWASALGHGIFRLSAEGRVRERLTAAEVLPQDHVTALACDLDGSLWIGTSWGGLARLLPDGTFRYHAATAGLPGDSIRRLVVAPDEAGGRTLWIATEGGAASYAGP